MKVLQLTQKCMISGGNDKDLNFEKDQFYIMSEDLCSKIKIILKSAVGMEIPFREILNEYDGQDLNNRKLLAIRHGGGGDILFMITGLAELKRRYPNSKLSVAISPTYNALVENNPNIDEIINLPISLDEWRKFHYHVKFENLIENNFSANQLNAYDLFMNQMKIDFKSVPIENKIPKIFLTEEEKNLQLEDLLPEFKFDKNKKKVGIQVEASSPIRNYPPYNFIEVSKELINLGYEVFFLGAGPQALIINYMCKTVGEGSYPVLLPLRTAMVLASSLDYLIAPDSIFTHIAGAFNIPAIGIFGPFPSKLRMAYFRHSIGIDARTICSPCFKHSHFPCEKGEPSPCFSLITPEVILEAFLKLVKE